MMEFTFDLISDLNIIDQLDWDNQPTSLFCVVAGNISVDRTILLDTLTHLSTHYKQVFYIDGPLDHHWQMADIYASYDNLIDSIKDIKNVVYCHNMICVINETAIISANGWWSFDWDDSFDDEQIQQHFAYTWHHHNMMNFLHYSLSDARYLRAGIEKLQAHEDINEIIVVTNTVPHKKLIEHDTKYSDNVAVNFLGNSMITDCLESDHLGKVSTWCFGNYPHAIDTEIDGVRYVSNPRGLQDQPWTKAVYYPLVIKSP